MAIQRWLVAYDTSCDSRRRKIVKLIMRVGERLQFSVFEVRVTPARLKLLQASLAEVLDEEDRLLMVPLADDALARSWCAGYEFGDLDAPLLL